MCARLHFTVLLSHDKNFYGPLAYGTDSNITSQLPITWAPCTFALPSPSVPGPRHGSPSAPCSVLIPCLCSCFPLAHILRFTVDVTSFRVFTGKTAPFPSLTTQHIVLKLFVFVSWAPRASWALLTSVQPLLTKCLGHFVKHSASLLSQVKKWLPVFAFSLEYIYCFIVGVNGGFGIP